MIVFFPGSIDLKKRKLEKRTKKKGTLDRGTEDHSLTCIT